MNTMGAVLVTNTDTLKAFLGKPFGTVNLDAVIEHVEVEGVQDPRFRGFWDEFFFDTDNSMFSGTQIFGPSIGKAEVIDVHVAHADIAINLSLNSEALYGGNVVENAVFGIEHQASPTVVSDNELNDCFIPILLIDAPNSRIEANSISGDNMNHAILVVDSASTIEDNTVIGTITGFDGAIELIFTEGAVIEDNKVFISAPNGAGIADFFGLNNVIHDNKISGSGLAAIMMFGATGDIVLDNKVEDFLASLAQMWLNSNSNGNTVFVDEETTVLDEGIDNVIIID